LEITAAENFTKSSNYRAIPRSEIARGMGKYDLFPKQSSDEIYASTARGRRATHFWGHPLLRRPSVNGEHGSEHGSDDGDTVLMPRAEPF
jgi:hypothetical protein